MYGLAGWGHTPGIANLGTAQSARPKQRNSKAGGKNHAGQWGSKTKRDAIDARNKREFQRDADQVKKRVSRGLQDA